MPFSFQITNERLLSNCHVDFCQFGITVDDNKDKTLRFLDHEERWNQSNRTNQFCLFSKSDLSPQEGEHVKLSDSTCNHFLAHLLRTAPVTNFLTPVTLKVARGHRSPYCSCEQWSWALNCHFSYFSFAHNLSHDEVVSFLSFVMLFFLLWCDKWCEISVSECHLQKLHNV